MRHRSVRTLLFGLCGIVLLLAGCSSSPFETASSNATPGPTPTVAQAPPVSTTGPTALAIPDSDVAESDSDVAEPDSTTTPTPDSIVTVTATAVPTAVTRPTPRPIPTVTPTVAPTAAPTSVPSTPVPSTPVPQSRPAATSLPIAPTPAPVGQPGRLLIECSISNNDVLVNETTTFTASYEPANAVVQFAFSHGDGTLDNGAVSQASYRQPGNYRVTLLWEHAGTRSSAVCGQVRVRAGSAPTPVPTTNTAPTVVQIGCSISPQRPVQVNEVLTFTAFQSVAGVPVSYVFDHGDGTFDRTAQSNAIYAAPGSYNVRLNWSWAGQNGSTFCGTVRVQS